MTHRGKKQFQRLKRTRSKTQRDSTKAFHPMRAEERTLFAALASCSARSAFSFSNKISEVRNFILSSNSLSFCQSTKHKTREPQQPVDNQTYVKSRTS